MKTEISDIHILWTGLLPINSTEKVDLICEKISQLDNLTIKQIERISLMVILDIQKIKIQLYFKDKISELVISFSNKSNKNKTSPITNKTYQNNNTTNNKSQTYLTKGNNQNNSKTKKKFSKEFIYMLFAGRKLSFINSKYNLNDKLNNMLEKTSYEINPDTIISTKMIDSFFTFFENILKSDSNSESLLRINSNQEKNIKKVSSYVEHTKNQNRDNNFNISSIPLTFKKRKPWKYGPDRLPVPNQYIHRSHKENVFEKEGNWGKIIKIRKR